MVWYVGRGYVIHNGESVNQSVTKVGIELLGQLKNITDNKWPKKRSFSILLVPGLFFCIFFAFASLTVVQATRVERELNCAKYGG